MIGRCTDWAKRHPSHMVTAIEPREPAEASLAGHWLVAHQHHAMEPAINRREHVHGASTVGGMADAAMEPTVKGTGESARCDPVVDCGYITAMEPAFDWRGKLVFMVRIWWRRLPQWSPPWPQYPQLKVTSV
jgi:hypothetical protein